MLFRSAKVITAWKKLPERKLFFRGMCAWLGFRIEQLPFKVRERKNGGSRWDIFSLIKLALTGLTSYTSKPLHLVTLIGIIFVLFSLLLATHTIFQKLMGIAVSGFTTVIILQLISGGLVMVALGIIGEYIARIFDEVKCRPRYIISQTTDNNNH